jgi:choline monooxygenase
MKPAPFETRRGTNQPLSQRAAGLLVESAVEADMARARTPAADFYLDGELFALTLERVFARSWLWAADERDWVQGALRHTALPCELLPGSLNEPLLLTRDGQQTRCLSNVCTHRARLLLDAPSQASGLRCGYHGRRFDLSGRLQSSPGFDGLPDFPAANDHLPNYPLERAGPWWFTRLEEGPEFSAWWSPVAQRIGHLPLDQAWPAPERSRDFELDAHWALYVENYLEGLHIPFIHPGLNAVLDFQSYAYELLPLGVLQLGEGRSAKDGAANSGPTSAAERGIFDLPSGHPDHGRALAAWYFWLFPNLMVNVYPWGISINRIEPLGPGRTLVRFRSYVFDQNQLGRGAGGDLDQVEREDERAVEAVQRGLAGRGHRRGRYAPGHDLGVHHFHRLWQRFLAGGC